MNGLMAASWNISPAASRLIFKGGRGGLTAALGATAPRKLSQYARRTLFIGARCQSSKSRARDNPNYARYVPIFAASTGLVLGALLYKRSGSSPIKMELTPGFHNFVDETKSNEPHIMIAPAIGAEPKLEVFETMDEISDLPVEDAILTTAPEVPPVITRDHAALVKVPLVTTTKLAQLTSQYKYEQWTFNGTVPGPFIRARVGDVVELTLTNKDKAGNPHNIDCHAFTGPGGGAAVTTAEENETKTGRFRLLYPGLYVYHCAAAPVPVHISNGMYGLMYVQPAENDLPPVDKEYYVMQSEFYHEPPEVDDDGRRSEIVEFSYPNGLREEPQVVAFNGSESALTRDHPLKANVGDDVRIFFGNAGPNLTSSFHVIGSHFRNVYRDGDVISPPSKVVQTVLVPSGGSTIVDLKMAVPGTYALVDHSIFRMDKGGVGFLNVSGPQNPAVYHSTQPPSPCVGCKLHA
ncbi:copper-containing nitrite reductase [Diaporthe sp. PMI_573]|nr:copper-containing nitrite reductase [Diaporthaceae sp. PMI_573]